MKVAVIGGGPGGLTTLKHLLTVHKYQDVKPIEAKLFESQESIGGTFRYLVWEESEVISILLQLLETLMTYSLYPQNTLLLSLIFAFLWMNLPFSLPSDTANISKITQLTSNYGRISIFLQQLSVSSGSFPVPIL
jgi:hypothetical protein